MEKIKVRIALEINPFGEWQAYGHHEGDSDDWMAMTDGLDCLDGHHCQRLWIEAEVPVPAEKPAAITGEAVPAKEADEAAPGKSPGTGTIPLVDVGFAARRAREGA